MRLALRWQILLLTALPLIALAGASLWLVDRGVSSRTEIALGDDLRRAATVFETLLAARAEELQTASAVIVRDPRFFAVLTLPHGPRDRDYRATMAGVAKDFHRITHPDVFEVADEHGMIVASVGSVPLQAEPRASLLKSALSGHPESRAIAQRGTHVLLVATPVIADRRVVGVLLMGTEVGSTLAKDLRGLTSSEVTFLLGGIVTRSTLDATGDRDAAMHMAERADRSHDSSHAALGRQGSWIALARPLPLAAVGSHQTYVLQRSFEAETAFLRAVRTHLFELGLFTLLMVALASSFIARHITRPILQLVQAAEAMESGRWDAPVDCSRTDEIGYLAARFDAMRVQQRSYVENLQQASRAKSEFISIASHELRTPIAVIRGWEGMFRTGHILPTNGRFTQGLDAIERACGTLERVAVDATRMADFGNRAASPETSHESVAEMIEEATREVQVLGAGRRVAVDLIIQAGAERAWVDRPLLLQAMHALISNGIRFTQDGGQVTVEARPQGDMLLIEVKDDGIGLSPETRRRLLDPTFVSHEAKHHRTSHGLEFNVPGLGFGLPLAGRVAEAHGGRLQWDGEEGRGSRFTLELPSALAASRMEDAA
ncbi:MAG: HAMP domain-containing sensor histidine kinase [Candidatus Eisenbacteria bacterium]